MIKSITRPALLCLLATVMFATCACGSSKEFASLRHDDNIEIIHIPRFVGMLSKAASPFISDKVGRSAAGGFSSMDIITCEKGGDRNRVFKAVADAVANDGAELLLYAQEGNEKTMIYGRPENKKKKIKDLTIVSEERSELSVVRIKGTFDIQDIIPEMD